MKIFIFLITLFFITSCYTKPKSGMGTIYGKLFFSASVDGKEIIKKVRLELSGAVKSNTIEPSGIFYFMNVHPGTYDLKVTAPGLRTCIVKNIQIAADSVSLIYNIYLSDIPIDSDLYVKWIPKKIGRVPLNKRGSLGGRVFELESGKEPKNEPWIKLKEIDLVVGTKNKRFVINDLLPGEYTISSATLGYAETIIKKVIIKPDSLAYVEIKLVSTIIGMDPYSYQWTAKYLNQDFLDVKK